MRYTRGRMIDEVVVLAAGYAGKAVLALARERGLMTKAVLREFTESLDRGTDNRVKGPVVALSLVREDGGRVEDEMAVYRDGDTFKAFVTCPPAMHAGWDLVVYERGQAMFPIPRADLTCGNDAPLPGRISDRRARAGEGCVWCGAKTDRSIASSSHEPIRRCFPKRAA